MLTLIVTEYEVLATPEDRDRIFITVGLGICGFSCCFLTNCKGNQCIYIRNGQIPEKKGTDTHTDRNKNSISILRGRQNFIFGYNPN